MDPLGSGGGVVTNGDDVTVDVLREKDGMKEMCEDDEEACEKAWSASEKRTGLILPGILRVRMVFNGGKHVVYSTLGYRAERRAICICWSCGDGMWCVRRENTGSYTGAKVVTITDIIDSPAPDQTAEQLIFSELRHRHL